MEGLLQITQNGIKLLLLQIVLYITFYYSIFVFETNFETNFILFKKYKINKNKIEKENELND